MFYKTLYQVEYIREYIILTFNVHNFHHQSHFQVKFHISVLFLYIYDVENIFVDAEIYILFMQVCSQIVTSLLTCFRDSQLFQSTYTRISCILPSRANVT